MRAAINSKLAQHGLTLPAASAPAGAYVPFVLANHFVYISGQLPFQADGTLITGVINSESQIKQGQEAAKLCSLQILAQLAAALPDAALNSVQVTKLQGFVAATPDFTAHPEIINPASAMMVDVFGERGRHVRIAVGVASLPRSASVEIAAQFEIIATRN